MEGQKESTNSDWLTPNKIILLVLVREACRKSAEEEEEEWKWLAVKKNRRFLLLRIPRLLRSSDEDFKSLSAKLETQDPNLSKLVQVRLEKLVEGGISVFGEFFQSLEELFSEQDPALHKTSLFGLFVRRMILSYNKLSFSQLSRFVTICQQAFQPNKTPQTQEGEGDVDISMDTTLSSLDLSNSEHPQEQSTSDEGFVSSKQADYFLTRQAALLDSCDSAALPPRVLQAKVDDIIKTAPDKAGAHYVSYLNNVRVGEFNGALSSLYHYYDCKQWDENDLQTTIHSDESDPEKCRRFRYASLNLAALHCVFDHKEEAFAALNEAIQMSQATNDPVCLEHALGWLYRLEKKNSLQARELLDRFISRASELSLPYLNSLGMLLKVKRSIANGETPQSVFQTLGKINVINFQKSISDLMMSALSENSAVWEFYGRSKLATVYDQCLLHQTPAASTNRITDWLPDLNTFVCPSSTQIQNSEATCIALCHLARHHAEQGFFSAAMEILKYTESVYTQQSRHASIWILCREKLVFEKALMTNDWKAAERAVKNIHTVDPLEAKLRQGVLLSHMDHYTDAYDKLQLVLTEIREDEGTLQNNKTIKVELESNVLLALSDLSLKTGNFSPAMVHALDCLKLCQEHFMECQANLVALHIAVIQLQINLPEKALQLLTGVMVDILAHSPLYVQSSAKLFYVECKLAASSTKEQRKSVLLSVLPVLNSALEGFEQLESHEKIRDVLYRQALVYNELQYTTERNKCAKKCCKNMELFQFVRHTGQSVL